jgi:hypothetical protein
MTDKLKVPKSMQQIFDAVAAIIDDFCEKHLNAEYSLVSRELAATLCRKRPSPLLKGKPAQWACACVYVVGSTNFLHDKTHSPHMPLAEVCERMGIGKSTARSKAKTIQELLKISNFDSRWVLPSRLESNPLIWQIKVNGFIVDARQMPRELQEEAFRRGLIPYVPNP